MATAKIKVSELAKSLGMTNAEMLELCKANNVAAKTPQSTLVEAFVPMLKRKAEAAGADGIMTDDVRLIANALGR